MEILLNKSTSKTSSNVNNFVPIELKGRNRVLPLETTFADVNEIELYNEERSNCNKIRLTCLINPICSNVLFNNITEIIKNDAELDRLLSHFCGCKYLAQHQPLPDVQGRIEPLSIIYLSSYGFVLGGQKNQSLSLLKDGDTFQILLEEESPIGSRLIQSTIKITEHIIGDDDKQCVFCAFTEIQEEDKRFLFERFNGKKYK